MEQGILVPTRRLTLAYINVNSLIPWFTAGGGLTNATSCRRGEDTGIGEPMLEHIIAELLSAAILQHFSISSPVETAPLTCFNKGFTYYLCNFMFLTNNLNN